MRGVVYVIIQSSLFAPVELIVNIVCLNYVIKLKADGTAKGKHYLDFYEKKVTVLSV